MRNFFIVLCLVLSACSPASNDPVGHYRLVENGYEIRLTGQRKNMSHDLSGMISSNTSKAEVKFRVPKLQGIVKGHEIPVEKGYYKYVGEILFNDEKMVVNLRVVDTDAKVEKNISWNGAYTLIPEPQRP